MEAEAVSEAEARAGAGNRVITFMKPEEFLDRLDDARIVAAIQEAERQTSGEIRVYVSNKKHGDVQAAAVRCFQRLKMEQTAERNAVLIFIVPKSRQFALLGDEGIHRHLASGVWEAVAREMSDSLRIGTASVAVEEAIVRLSQELARHFPYRKNDRNELPDDVLRDDEG